LGYEVKNTVVDYGINLTDRNSTNTIIFLHGTTWPTKHWPENYWQTLAQYVTQAGYRILLPWGNSIEHERAQRIATISAQIEVLPKLNLSAIANILANAK